MIDRHELPGWVAWLMIALGSACGGANPHSDGGQGEPDLAMMLDAAADAPDAAQACSKMWVGKASMATARQSLASAPVTINGVAGVLAMGGGSCTVPYLSTAEFFASDTGVWTPVISMTAPRLDLAAAPVTIGGVAGVLAIGGTTDGSAPLKSAEFFNPTTGGWTPVAAMGAARQFHAATPLTVNGVAGVLVAGGNMLASTEFFDPNANTWTPMSSMSTMRLGGAMAPVTFGGVAGALIAGGEMPGMVLATAEFFDPNANTWTPVNSMGSQRYTAAASPATVGGVAGVVVSGGHFNSSYMSAEFFNPSANGWLPVGSMATVHSNHGSAPLTIAGVTGVLVEGGSGTGSCTIQTNAEFFCP